MIIPNFTHEPIVNSSDNVGLYLTAAWQYWFDQLITQLQNNIGTEGFVVSSLSSASSSVTPPAGGGQIAQIQSDAVPGTLVFDTNANDLLCAFLIEGSNPPQSIFRSLSSSSGNWTVITVSTSIVMAIDTGYIVDAGSGVNMTLPVLAEVGSIITLIRIGAGDFTVKQNTGQTIQFGNMTTTTGTGGSLASMNIGDSLTLLCTIEDTTWGVLSSVGNFTIV